MIKGKIFYYSGNIKKLPTGLIIFLGLLFLVLIPVILALGIAAGITAIAIKTIGSILPKKKLSAFQKKDGHIEDIEFEEITEEPIRRIN
jgi:hypothetical protein